MHFIRPESIILAPLYVKLNFDSKLDSKASLNKVYVTLFTCASRRGVILDVVPRLDASSFIQSINRSSLVDAGVQNT